MTNSANADGPSLDDILASIRKIIKDEPAVNAPLLPVLPQRPTAVLGSVGVATAPSQLSRDTDRPDDPVDLPRPAKTVLDVQPKISAVARSEASNPAASLRSMIDDDLGDLFVDAPPAVNLTPAEPARASTVLPPPPATIAGFVPFSRSIVTSTGAEVPPPRGISSRFEPVAFTRSSAATNDGAVGTVAPVAKLEPTTLIAAMPVRPTPAAAASAIAAAAEALDDTSSVASSGSSAFSSDSAPVVEPVRAAAPSVSLATPPSDVPRSVLRPVTSALDFLKPAAQTPVSSEVVTPKREPVADAVLAIVGRAASSAAIDEVVKPVGTKAASTVVAPAPATEQSAPDQPAAPFEASLPKGRMADKAADEAVASALGALAAGLAASVRPQSVRAPERKVEVPFIAPVAPIQAAVGDATPSATSPTVTAPVERCDPTVHTDELPEQGGVPSDEATASLLRPMLRQWLNENMPRIVEKALRLELGETSDKKGALGVEAPASKT